MADEYISFRKACEELVNYGIENADSEDIRRTIRECILRLEALPKTEIIGDFEDGRTYKPPFPS